MDDHVRRKQSRIPLVGDDALDGVAIERRSANRPPIRDLGPEFDLQRQPVLPTYGRFVILRAAAGAGAPPIRVVIPFRAEGYVVQRIDCIVDIEDRADRIRVALEAR